MHNPNSSKAPGRHAIVDAALEQLFLGRDLERSFARALFEALVDGLLDEPAMAAMFIAFRMKGESFNELVGAAQALRAADKDFPRPSYPFADSCGTGGDGSGSMNVSTAVALVAAAAGLRMAKHGNRSFSSLCGSADVLEALGAKLDVTPARSRHLLDAIGFCFLFAPNYHPGLKHAGPVRRRLRVRTIMNLLGPCLNPSEPPIQLLGVADPLRLQGVSSTLIELGVERALVVHGSGLDEVALHGVTDAIRITNGFAESIRITPADAGLEKVTLDELRGGRSVKEKAEQLKAVLGGYAPSSLSNLVAINTGALLWTAGVCDTLKEASALAAETIAAGKAGRLLKEYVELSRFE